MASKQHVGAPYCFDGCNVGLYHNFLWSASFQRVVRILWKRMMGITEVLPKGFMLAKMLHIDKLWLYCIMFYNNHYLFSDMSVFNLENIKDFDCSTKDWFAPQLQNKSFIMAPKGTNQYFLFIIKKCSKESDRLWMTHHATLKHGEMRVRSELLMKKL